MELIDKNALVKYLEGMGNKIYAGNDEYFIGQKAGLMKVVGVVMTFPAVEERKHGHWIELEPDKYGNFIQCSVCDSKFGLYSKDNYCQACGAIMENNGDDDDE